MAAKTAPLNYEALTASDPILQAKLRAISGQGAIQQGQLSQARQQALIGYGAVPDAVTSPALTSLLGGIAPDITQTTRDLAQQGTDSGLSTLGQLRQGYTDKQRGDIGSLGGRGMLRSGEYRERSLENLHGLQTGEANAQQGLLSNLSGLWSGYQGEQQQNTSDAQTATSDALTRILGQINAGTLASPTKVASPGAPPPSGVAPGNVISGVPKPPPNYGFRPVPVIPRASSAAPTGPRPLQ